MRVSSQEGQKRYSAEVAEEFHDVASGRDVRRDRVKGGGGIGKARTSCIQLWEIAGSRSGTYKRYSKQAFQKLVKVFLRWNSRKVYEE